MLKCDYSKVQTVDRQSRIFNAVGCNHSNIKLPLPYALNSHLAWFRKSMKVDLKTRLPLPLVFAWLLLSKWKPAYLCSGGQERRTTVFSFFSAVCIFLWFAFTLPHCARVCLHGHEKLCGFAWHPAGACGQQFALPNLGLRRGYPPQKSVLKSSHS